MRRFTDVHGRGIRLTNERLRHVREAHPELTAPLSFLGETLQQPDQVRRSRTDPSVELYYRYYEATPVTSKYCCAVVKATSDPFLITLYFTDTIKRGEVLWRAT